MYQTPVPFPLCPKFLHLGSAALAAVCLGAATVVAQPNRPSEAGQTGIDYGSGPRSPETMTSSRGGATDSNLAQADQKFIEKAAKKGQKELALSQLATERASRQQVREYAQQLVDDHHNVNQQLTRLAQNKGVVLKEPGGMSGVDRMEADASGGSVAARTASQRRADEPRRGAGGPGEMGGTARRPEQREDRPTPSEMSDERQVRALAQRGGEEFDQQYVRLMVKEHEDAVNMFEKAAQDARDPQVRSFASQHVPTLREHLQEAKNLRRRVAE